MAPDASEKPFVMHRFPVTPGVIWAMACQTLRQCIRRKVLFVLLFFVATVLIGSRVIPSHEPVKRLEAIITLCLYSISFYGVIVSIFLAATVLPDDRRTKAITTLMTKPVGRLNYLLGRMLGFSMTLGIILAVMGLASWGFIRAAGAVAERDSGRTDLLVGKRGIDATDIVLLDNGKKMTLKEDADAATFSGSTDQKIVFGFRSGLDKLGEGDQTVEMSPEITAGAKFPRSSADVTVENPVTKEKRSFRVMLDSGRAAHVTFPRSLVDPAEGVNVTVQRLESGTYVTFARDAFELETSPAGFEWSYFKSLLMIFFGFVLIIVVSITTSTFLTSWVAVLLSFVAYFFAEFQDVLLDFMANLKGTNAGLLGSHFMEHVHGPVYHPPDTFLVTAVNNTYYAAMWVLTHIFPNFDRFDASSWLTSARDVPASAVGTALVVFVGYGVCYLVIGHVIFHKRELAS